MKPSLLEEFRFYVIANCRRNENRVKELMEMEDGRTSLEKFSKKLISTTVRTPFMKLNSLNSGSVGRSS